MGLKEPRWTASISKNGGVRIYTAYDGDKARVAAKCLARLLLQRYSDGIAFKQYKMSKVQVVAKLPFRIRIEDFVAKNFQTSGSADGCPRFQVLRSLLHVGHVA